MSQECYEDSFKGLQNFSEVLASVMKNLDLVFLSVKNTL